MHGAKRKIQMISKFLASFIIAIAAFGASQALAADTSSGTSPSISPSNSGDNLDLESIKTVQGSAHFEMHHTLIPLICTPELGCAKSQPYWTVVINSGGIDYELDAQFELGNGNAPSSLTVLGVKVLPGSLISVEGSVEYTGDHYVLLNEVRRIGLVRSDYQQPIFAYFMNWSCRGQLDDKTQILAEIWHAGTDLDQESRYRVRVSGSKYRGDTRQLFDIGYVDDAHANRSVDQTIYDGKNSTASFTVAIQNAVVSHDVPGTLKLSVLQTVLDESVPMDEQVSILCNRTR
jgi:hypothetical protein